MVSWWATTRRDREDREEKRREYREEKRREEKRREEKRREEKIDWIGSFKEITLRLFRRLEALKEVWIVGALLVRDFVMESDVESLFPVFNHLLDGFGVFDVGVLTKQSSGLLDDVEGVFV